MLQIEMTKTTTKGTGTFVVVFGEQMVPLEPDADRWPLYLLASGNDYMIQ